MAESKNAKKAAQAAATSEAEVVHDSTKKEKQTSRWTVDTCKRASKRFDSQDAWAHGHPSSFKAASAKGWMTECCAHMTHKTAAPKAAKSTRTAAKPKTVAKTAGKGKRTA